jgi:AcrR family transcriptional regulator
MISSSTPTRIERKRAQNRQALVDSARRVFARDGFEGATIAAIAEEADLGFGTFYSYFPDKRAVLAAIEDEMRQDMDGVLGAPDNREGPASEALTRFTRRFAELVERNRDVMRLLWQMAMREGRRDPESERFPARLTDAIAAMVERGIESGEFADGEPAALARFLTSAHFSLLAPAGADEQIAEALCAFELRALRGTRRDGDG